MFVKGLPVKGNMNSYTGLNRIIQNIHYILFICPVKKKGRQLDLLHLIQTTGVTTGLKYPKVLIIPLHQALEVLKI